MPIIGAIISKGATYTPSGGTAITFNRIGESIPNGIVCANTAQTDFFAREKLTASSREPVKQADGSWSKRKTAVRISRLYTRADGTVVPEVLRIEMETDPESGVGTINDFKSLGAGVLTDADFTNLFANGDLS